MSAWFRHYEARDEARLRLVCMPNAGGGASFYHRWSEGLPSDVEVLAIQYPGRQERSKEPPCESMEDLVAAITEALRPMSDLPVALFGHSIGASVAYEVACRLEAMGDFVVALLVVSAARPPTESPYEGVQKSDDDLIREVVRYGGVDPEVFEDEELRALALPNLRADFRLREGYMPTGHRLSAPIIAYLGEHDQELTPAEVGEWGAITEGEFALRMFPGGHFYLVEHRDEVLADLSVRLRALT